jgi:NADH-quinone oxidoreductase subunit K
MLPLPVPFEHVMALAIALFVVGVLGVVLRRSLIVMIMSVEIMLNAGNLLFVAFAERWAQPRGHAIVFFVMAIAAAEAAVGLAILIGVFRTHQTTSVDEIHDLLEQA